MGKEDAEKKKDRRYRVGRVGTSDDSYFVILDMDSSENPFEQRRATLCPLIQGRVDLSQPLNLPAAVVIEGGFDSGSGLYFPGIGNFGFLEFRRDMSLTSRSYRTLYPQQAILRDAVLDEVSTPQALPDNPQQLSAIGKFSKAVGSFAGVLRDRSKIFCIPLKWIPGHQSSL